MNKLLKIFSLTMLLGVVVSACNKVADLPSYADGATPTLAASKTTVVLTRADSTNNVVTFSWNDPKYANTDSTTKYLIEIDTAGANFARPFTKQVNGKLSAAYTGNELNNMILNYGGAVGAPYNLEVRLVSSYANNNQRRISNKITLSVSAFTEPNVLSSDKSSVTGTVATGGNDALTFNWTQSFKSYSGVVSYSIEYDSTGKNFAAAKSIAGGASVFSKTMKISEVNDNAFNCGIAYGSTGKVDYRVKAQTALGAIVYSNTVTITVNTYLPILNMYLVGSVNGWDINNPLQIIFDKKAGRFNKVYFTYVKMNAGDKFKFAQTPGNWGSTYGKIGGDSTNGFTTGYNQGGDFEVAYTGVYRLTLDVANGKVFVQLKQVGIVGSMQGWTAGSPIFGAYAGRDKFLIVANSSGTDNFKFHDGFVWDNSTIDKARWWGKGSGTGNLDDDGNGGDIAASSTPRTRAIWDGTDKMQIKYELSSAAEMRLVGDGIDSTGVNDWDPGSSPQMTYLGNGKWQINIKLKANKDIKFLAGNAWGAFDYEDNSGQSQSVGTPRNIKWDGGSNFKTPAAAGRYTIILDEHAQTATIN